MKNRSPLVRVLYGSQDFKGILFFWLTEERTENILVQVRFVVFTAKTIEIHKSLLGRDGVQSCWHTNIPN